MAAADRVYRSVLAYTRFFSKGWGPVETYERMLETRHVVLSRDGCIDVLKTHSHPVHIKKIRSIKEGVLYDGAFRSPLASYLPGLLPKESEIARFELALPHRWSSCRKPMYIHLAGTGDHYYWRRRSMTVLPTLKASNIGAVCLENPFYGSRKPREQTRSQLNHVSDLFVMGLALILECMVLMHWLEGEGLGPVGLTGISMGGHNSSLAAALWPKPVPVVPCLSWSTASSVFTEGLLSSSVCWDVLEEQLFYSQIGADENRRKLFKIIEEFEPNLPPIVGGGTRDWSPRLWGSGEISNFVSEGERRGRVELHETREGENSSMVTSLSQFGLASLFLQWFSSTGGGGGEEKMKVNDGQINNSVGFGVRKLKVKPQLLEAMRKVLDFSTHLRHFPTPLSPNLALFLVADDDRYIPRGRVTDVRSLWPGCHVEHVSGGHVSTTLLQQHNIRNALATIMDMV